MEAPEVSQGRKVTSFEMKTDLNLLLECLKFQMDNPDSQKETLAAVRSICQDNSDACDYFRDIGGLIFLNNLAKSSAHSLLKEASLYTLAILTESNVYCQQTLCTAAIFEDVHTILSDETSSVNLKRMSVFLFLVLVSNNKTGQSLAKESGCMETLLILFSKILTCNVVLASGNSNPQYQLWSSVCSALCVCVNNPQNEENQKLCSSAFPQAIKRLQGSLQHEMVRPICSMIGLTVANSRFAQDSFASIGGLDILADVLSHLVNGLQENSLDVRLAIVVTKTLDACIAENSKSVHRLEKHNIISSLMNLLSCGNLEAEDKFSIVLTIGHLTEDCEANQYELLKSHGLPLMIQVLAQSQDDELHKAATFVLQNCRAITETLSVNEQIPREHLGSASSHTNQRERCLHEYWGKAEEIFHKIQKLQQQYDEDTENIQGPERGENADSAHGKSIATSMHWFPNLVNHPKYRDDRSRATGFHGEENVRREIILDKTKLQKSTVSTSGRLGKTCSDSPEAQETCADLPNRDQSGRPYSSRNNITSRDAVTQTLPDPAMENLHNDHPPPHRDLSVEDEQSSPQAFPATDLRVKSCKPSTPGRQEKDLDPMVICADIIDKEISSVLKTQQKSNELQCSGCLMTAPVMNSRSCSKILTGCPNLCDRHRVILEAEERYRTEYRKLLYGAGSKAAQKNIQLTPLRREEATDPNIKGSNRILLTPIRKAQQKSSPCSKTPSPLQESKDDRAGNPKRQEKTHNKPEVLEVQAMQTPKSPDQSQPPKKTRKDFTHREIAYLLDGVQKLGHHWNAILWSYPFQKGRRNVDLAKKYKQLQGKR
ncbi:telomere repeats-binding bouquet formation protein 1 isoform X2 [Dendrobates tinctorius]|uniref:telomere repeats-binding bouquet formation protein 1 isoform X2 n=1 Tax=Dendrobates tinctorius TaxID=92724 RepID=UPI003CC9582A